jgi:multicomponent Na+:H+ antiporter subunit B
VSSRIRVFLFTGAAIAAAGLWAWGAWGLPGFGRYPGPYGTVINHLVTRQRHATDAVTTVTFDYRGFDTIGEEYILFASAVGASVLLRLLRGEHETRPRGQETHRQAPEASEAVRLLGVALPAFIVVLGIYTVSHGHLTPGGGFQGGVILAGAALGVFLAARHLGLRRMLPKIPLELGDAIGAAGFVGIGLATLALGASYLQNIVPLGATGQLTSAGFIPMINALVGLEVGSAVVLIVSEFLVQAESVEVGSA